MPRVDRNRQLLQVAEAVFAERGIGATSMDEVAERAGVTKPVLYNHFGSKDGLLAALIERTGSELGTAIESAVAGASDPADGMNRGLSAYFAFIEQHQAAWLALQSETPANSAAAGELEKIRHDRASFIAGLVIAELPDIGSTRAMSYANAVVGACERLATATPPEGPLRAEDLAADLMDVIWVGFERLRSGEGWSQRPPG